MSLKDLSERFHHAKLTLEDHRIELFQKEKQLNELQGKSYTTEEKLQLYYLSDEIKQLKNAYSDEQINIAEIGYLLLEELKAAGIKPNERVPYLIRDSSYFDVWYLDTDEPCCTLGAYTRVE